MFTGQNKPEAKTRPTVSPGTRKETGEDHPRKWNRVKPKGRKQSSSSRLSSFLRPEGTEASLASPGKAHPWAGRYPHPADPRQLREAGAFQLEGVSVGLYFLKLLWFFPPKEPSMLKISNIADLFPKKE